MRVCVIGCPLERVKNLMSAWEIGRICGTNARVRELKRWWRTNKYICRACGRVRRRIRVIFIFLKSS